MQPNAADGSAEGRHPALSLRFIWIFWVFLAIGLTLLALEHRGHLVGAWPYLLLLACPLMHLFMHRGHGDHGGHMSSQRDGGR